MPRTQAEPVLLIADEGPVRTLTLNRPEKLNALNTPLTQALLDALTEADADESVRAIVLAGAGRGFCAGADLSEFSELTPKNTDAVEARAELTMRSQMLAQQLSKPVISVVQGVAVGGGAGLAIGTDMTVVSADVRFGYPEMRHSIVPAIVMTGLRAQVGVKLAFELVSTGRLLGAHEMRDIGLANVVAEPDAVRQRGAEIAHELAKAHPKAMAATKGLFYKVGDLAFEDAMAEGRRVNELMRSFRDE